MFNALCKRRNIRFKYEKLAHGITASAVYNVNRATPESPMISAFDFVRSEEASERRAERLRIIGIIKQTIGAMPSSTPREKFLKVRANIIAELKALGRDDAEAIFDECWPSLKPKE